MCSLKLAITLVTLSIVVLAAPGGFGSDEQGGQQGGYSGSNQGGFGGNYGGQQRDQGVYGGNVEGQRRFENYGSQQGGQGSFSGNQGGQGGFGNNGGQQGGQGGFGGNHGGQPGGQFMPPPPPFLQNVTEEARRAFMAIATNSSLTLAEIETQTEAWATTYGVSDQYNAFISNVTEKIEELKQNVTSVLSNMSSVMNSLETILGNTDQTVAQQQEAIESLREESPAEVGALFYIAQEVGRPTRQGTREGVSGRPNFSEFSTTTVSA